MNHKDTKNTEEIQENVFEIENPEECNCRLWIYDKGHSSLEIRVFCPASQEEFFIQFQMVEFFSGVTSWTGANFRILSKGECIELLAKHHPQFTEPFIKNNNLMDVFPFRLYTVETREGSVIQIIASIAGVVNQDEI